MRYSLLLLGLMYITSLNGQTSSGTNFWLAYMENLNLLFNDPPQFAIQVDADLTTDGEIVVPTTGLSIPFTAQGGEVTEVFLPDAVWYALGSEDVEEKGVQITTDLPVRVSAFHYRSYFSESTQLLPIEELGVEYLLSCYLDEAEASPTSFVIVAPSNDVTLEIIPSTLTFGLRPAGIPFTIDLEEGETYQVQAAGDLTGTRVRSLTGQPIAVFSGARQANIGICPFGADSHVYEQAIPIDQWGDIYFFIPFRGQGYDIVKVLAAEDNTTVYFDCEEVANLNEGEQFITQLAVPTVINATAPVAVSQFNTSQSCSPSQNGDPNMMRLLPSGYFTNEVRWLSSGLFSALIGGTYFSEHFVNVIIPTSETGALFLDGGQVNASNFSPLPGLADFSYAQLVIESGNHILSSTANFQAYSYGFGEFDAYTTRLGYSQVDDTPFACLDIEVEGPFCVDSVLTFSFVSGQEIVNQEWSFDGQDFSSALMPQYVFTEEGEVAITLSVQDSNGGVQTAVLIINILQCEEDICDDPVSLIVEVDSLGCANDEIPLNFIFDGEVLNAIWSFDNGLTVEGLDAQVIISEPGAYPFTLTITDIYNCQYQASGIINVQDCGPCPPELVDPQFEGVLCIDSLVTFLLPFEDNPNPPVLIEWNINGEIFTEPNPTVVFTEAGSIQLTFFAIDLLGCTFNSELEFQIQDCENNPCIDLAPVEISLSGVFCEGALITANAQTSANLVSYEWFTTFEEQGSTATFTFSVADQGIETIYLTAQDELGCTYDAGIDIEIEDCGTIGNCNDTLSIIIDSTIVCTDSIINFTTEGVTNLISYNWDFGDEIVSTEPNPNLAFSEGDYLANLEATDSNGCNYLAFADFIVEPCLDPESCKYNYPNVFTPNSDGVNDTFDLLYACPPESYELLIFNRWGAMVFKSTDVQLGWDGTFKGKPAPIEVYVYLASITGIDGTKIQLQGNMSLLR